MTPKLIQKSSDLVTTHRAVCDGFLGQALSKTQKAIPFIEDALEFWTELKNVSDVTKLLEVAAFRDRLLAAAGFSEKAILHLSEEELTDALEKVFQTTFHKAGANFREEIFYRYLLTKGDALGGQMRNFTGAAAQLKLASALLKALDGSAELEIKRAPMTNKIQRISWQGRRLLFDVKPKLIGKSVDVILLAGRDGVSEIMLLEEPVWYLACGELKGGIDPAGADEHWKTANSALNRIRKVFGRTCPPLFFIGAAIEASMAKEIFRELKNGKLTHAANLTVDAQVQDLASWLVAL